MLLLYSGGLDTSVMLRWIQDPYEAEIVTLTVNLGQPGEDYGVIEAKARELGAVEATWSTPARIRRRVRGCRRSRPTPLYGGGYPLFTALGRPLIAKLAVEYARASRAATRSPTAAPARATTRSGSRPPSRRWLRS